MTPAARIAAAAEVLDRILAGASAEQALVNWGRANRFAGSGDRAALRDLVFDALRCRRSFAALGGGLTGRGLMLGRLRARGEDPAPLFSGTAHALSPPGADEGGRPPQAGAEALDVPDWLLPELTRSLGATCAPVLEAMRHRAPVGLRVNAARATRAAAQAMLAAEGVETRLNPLASFALDVTAGERKIRNCQAYLDGLVELQDPASQAVVEALPLRDGMRVLDHCAGGGGKTLAMAARARLDLWAHDAALRRMADLPVRAARAAVRVGLTEKPERSGPYDLILVDAPCSGSGSWRRDPEGKWALTPARLAEVMALQSAILDRAARMVRLGGWLAYATCSLLRCENDDQISDFISRTEGWTEDLNRHFTLLDGGDGFFLSLMRRS